MKDSVRLLVTIRGYVQGVGYRYFCYKKAILYGVKGSVENRFNGDVELEIEGNEGLLNDFIKELKIGPGGAVVDSIHVKKLEYAGKFQDFIIQ
jgi:acylphosphatase